MSSPLRWPAWRREQLAGDALDVLTPIMAVLSVILLLVILGESLAEEGTGLETAFFIAGWLLWAVFAAEFVVRVVIAPDAGSFIKRNWWQIAFLLLPFLRVIRLVAAMRVLRAGRVLSGAVRSSRSSRRALGDRIMWLAALTIIVILAGSQLLFEFGDYDSYSEALRATAIAATVGEPLVQDDPWAALIEWALLVYSVVIFAALAGMVGAYLLERRRRPESGRDAGTDSSAAGSAPPAGQTILQVDDDAQLLCASSSHVQEAVFPLE